ncbi:uncharacterized protein C8Q71DRAFT_225865 [Rhodofomes roseus]|uniref:Uncharacterized protein n=1 Tax=Rhodofomes roseus TaxID=34475 RepID=A0ABQ8KUX9_9APHY|nr:uncharacterized protein C8Q71DRAFT_225865 [Rhodofomes roseus]KAH9842885.1 hypothetical protein C8Q71DRAFT_225865 [Rhodofomes roseus]
MGGVCLVLRTVVPLIFPPDAGNRGHVFRSVVRCGRAEPCRLVNVVYPWCTAPRASRKRPRQRVPLPASPWMKTSRHTSQPHRVSRPSSSHDALYLAQYSFDGLGDLIIGIYASNPAQARSQKGHINDGTRARPHERLDGSEELTLAAIPVNRCHRLHIGRLGRGC